MRNCGTNLTLEIDSTLPCKQLLSITVWPNSQFAVWVSLKKVLYSNLIHLKKVIKIYLFSPSKYTMFSEMCEHDQLVDMSISCQFCYISSVNTITTGLFYICIVHVIIAPPIVRFEEFVLFCFSWCIKEIE